MLGTRMTTLAFLHFDSSHLLMFKFELVSALQLEHPEQQIILWAFGYLNPSKLNPLGKIIFSFFGLSKDTHKMKINWVKLIKQKE